MARRRDSEKGGVVSGRETGIRWTVGVLLEHLPSNDRDRGPYADHSHRPSRAGQSDAGTRRFIRRYSDTEVRMVFVATSRNPQLVEMTGRILPANDWTNRILAGGN